MLRRRKDNLCASGVIALLAVTTAQAQGQSAGAAHANNGAAIAQDIESAPASVEQAADSGIDEAAKEPGDGFESGAAPVQPSAESNPSELLALGSPPSGGQDQDAADDPRSGDATSSLGALDPRHNEVVRVVGALCIVMLFLLAFRAILLRAGGSLSGRKRPSGVVEVLARYPLARGQHLVLFRLGARIILLHQTKAAVTALSEVTDPDEVAALRSRIEAAEAKPRDQRFHTMLRSLSADSSTFDSGDGEIVDLTRRSVRRRAWPARRGRA